MTRVAGNVIRHGCFFGVVKICIPSMERAFFFLVENPGSRDAEELCLKDLLCT